MTSLGGAELITTVTTAAFDRSLKDLEARTAASFARMAKQSEGIFSGNTFGTVTADAKRVETALAGVATGANKVKREVDPLQDQIRGLANAANNLRVEYEGGDKAQDAFSAGMRRVIAEAKDLRATTDANSTSYGRLTSVIGQGTRNLTTASGEMSRLGLSQQVAIGNSRKLGDSFNALQGAIGPVVGGAGLVGLVGITGRFVGEAQRAESAANLFAKSIERFGLDADGANALVTKLSDQFGVLPSTVQGAATTMLRAGASLEDVDKALTAAGASAAASGFNISTAFDNVGTAVATGRSELLESSGIITNASTAYQAYADKLGVSTEALTQAQKVQALSAAIYEESRFEIEDLTSVLTPQVRAQQDFRTAMAEARQELGGAFAPALSTGATLVAGLVGEFTALPDAAQASVTSVGGVTLGVGALATGLTALRPLLAATFLPPAGYIVAGAVALGTLGAALYQVVDNANNSVAPFKTLGENASVTQSAIGKAQDKESLVGALSALSTQLDGKAKASVDTFAEGIRTAKGDVDELRQSASDLVTQVTLDQLLVERAKLVTQLKVVPTVQDGDPNAIVAELQDRLNRSAEFQGLGVQIELGINKENGQYAVEVLSGIGKNATLSADAFALLDDSLNQANGQLNAVANSAGATLQRELLNTDTLINSLRESLNGAGDTAEETGDTLSNIPPVPPGTPDSINETGTALRSTADDAIAYADAISGINAVDLNPNFRQGLTDEAAALRAATRAQEEYQTSRLEGARQSEEASARSAAAATREGEALDAALRSNLTARRDEQAALAESERAATLLKTALAELSVSGYSQTIADSNDFSDSLTALNSSAFDLSGYLREGGAGAESLSDSLRGLNAEAADANTLMRESAGGAENFSDSLSTLNQKALDVSGGFAELRALQSEIDNLESLDAGELETYLDKLYDLAKTYPAIAKALGPVIRETEEYNRAQKAAAVGSELLTETLDMVLGKLGEFAGGFEGAGESTGQFLSNFADGLSALLRLDFVGFIGAAVNAVVDLFTYGAREADQYAAAVGESGQEVAAAFQRTDWMGATYFDEEGYERYKSELAEYAAAVEKYGGAIADSFVKINEAGEVTFDEAAFDSYVTGLEQGAQRMETVANNVEATLQTMTDGFADVRDAEASAAQAQLDANLEAQGGEHTLDTILQEQTIALNEALATRQEALARAAELEAAGQYELAARLRNAAQTEYDANVSQIEQNAANQAQAIGQATDQNLLAIEQNTGATASSWQTLYEADAAAQMEAQRWAAEQMRRQNQVINDARYAELIASGVSWEEAYRIRAAELGYTIDEASGYMLTADEAAGIRQSEGISANGAAVATAIINSAGEKVAAFGEHNTRLATAGGGTYDGLKSALGTASNGLVSLLGTNLGNELTAIAGRESALNAALSGSAVNLANAAIAGGNLEKTASFAAAQAKLKQEQLNANALVKTQVDSANLQSKTITGAANLIAGQLIGGGRVGVKAQYDSATAQLKQVKLSTDGIGKGLAGSGNFLSKTVANVENTKAKNTISAAKVAVGAFHAAFTAQAKQVAVGTAAVKSSLINGAFAAVAKVDVGGLFAGAVQSISAGSFDFGNIDMAQVNGAIKVAASQMGYGDLRPTKLEEVDDLKGGSGKGSSGSGKGSGSGKSGSGSGSSKGGSSGGKKDGSTYTGGKSDSYPVGSPGWYQAKMQEIEEQIKKTSSPSKIRELQAKKEKLQADLDKLLGKAESQTAGATAGSVNALQESIRKEQATFDSAATDKARAESAARLKILKEELEKKQAVLRDAEQAAASGRQNVITIESPIANLEGIVTQTKAALERAGLSASYASTTVSSGTLATAQAAPLPAYAAQQEMMNVPMFNSATVRFDGSTVRFDKTVSRLEALVNRQGNAVAAAFRGLGVTGFTL